MQLKTILNRVQRHKGFVYESCKLKGKKSVMLEVTVRAVASKFRCLEPPA